MKVLEIKSPTRGCEYTLEEVLKKGLVRSALRADKFEIQKKHECFYGSKDFYLVVKNFGPSESRWNDSVNFRIDGVIPLHTTEAGRIQYGFLCGCDSSHGGQFPSNCPPDNANWEKYKNIELGEITISTDSEKVVVKLKEFEYDKYGNCTLEYNHPYDYEIFSQAVQLLERMIIEMIARRVLSSM